MEARSGDFRGGLGGDELLIPIMGNYARSGMLAGAGPSEGLQIFPRAFYTNSSFISCMTIWLLSLLLIASVAAMGYRQGAVRVACSFVGILLGALLAVPLGHLLSRVLPSVGIKDPLWAWALGPIIVFFIISFAAKAGATVLHQKVDVYYKYRAGDLRLALWERLNHRLGGCLGVLNGALYLILLTFVLYVAGYGAVQVATSDNDPRWIRLAARFGRDLQATGLDKVARAIDRLPDTDYKMMDLGGLLYHNSLLQARLSRYPAFLALAERPEFQDIGGDKDLTEAWQRLDPVMTLVENPKVQAVRSNPGLLKELWRTVAPDVDDLITYLEKTGISAKYDDEKILGRWNLDPNLTISLYRRSKPYILPADLQNTKRRVASDYAKVTLVAMPDSQVLLKNLPSGTGTTQNQTGQWKQSGAKYDLSIGGKDESVSIENDRIVIKRDGLSLALLRES